MLLGYINPFEMIGYWISQVIGCAIGALWLRALIPNIYIWEPIKNSDALAHSGCFIPQTFLKNSQIYGWEAVCTFCFITPIFAVVWYTNHKPGYGTLGPIMIGIALTANALAAGQYTGAALNPARTVGSPIVFSCPNEKLYLYILGQFTAAIIAPFILIPWYGIAQKPWYRSYFPLFVKKFINLYQPSVRLDSRSSDRTGSPNNTTLDIQPSQQ